MRAAVRYAVEPAGEPADRPGLDAADRPDVRPTCRLPDRPDIGAALDARVHSPGEPAAVRVAAALPAGHG